MTKTAPPGEIEIPGAGSFALNVLPDVFDERDLSYRPSLAPLEPVVDTRAGRYVMKQEGESCTGHALAALINNLLRDTGAPVSPYMLYDLARRYDEFEGTADIGSSLRGALKGWYHHGVLPEEDWRFPDPDPLPDLSDPKIRAECLRRPMGAYYRVDLARFDDLQSAIREIGSVCVSAVLHDGWIRPERERHDGETMHVIRRPPRPTALGGHAFVLVGYNAVGFLVQNSWGRRWGRGGYATLPYDELDLLDAWVARLGVPGTPSAGSIGRVADGPRIRAVSAPDPVELREYVVNIGNDGKLSREGPLDSSPAQIDGIFTRMRAAHETWARDGGDGARHVVLYAHGGLTGVSDGLRIAQANLQWWRNNRVYPVFFSWQTGPWDTLIDQVIDLLRTRVPVGAGLGFFEGVDRLAEALARTRLAWAWKQMKDNADLASAPVTREVDWRSTAAEGPGATLTALRLRRYVTENPGVKVHLVSHSAGAIFLAGLLERLAALRVPVETLTFTAPAIRVDAFLKRVLPHLGNGQVRSFATFALSDRLELDDVCGVGPLALYHKSILYLVSRGFEGPSNGEEVPLLGMEKFFDRPDGDGGTLRKKIAGVGGTAIFSHSFAQPLGRCDATSHSDFDSNALTMTSIVARVLGLREPGAGNGYRPYAPRQR
ncbi:C1 family peptidase [Planobispora siamensis]|uniref:Peptidase C1A papain C-terminal domain-containing protein n=1 Tax=Planobispora siamensis TaxID=936338 RepID=A0A8J3ST62_9ACTN|nr:C1 family peptidase [Planobispora siamensis]GIH95158.1 hypothetical protein Psi01_57880 [Planobispora siamensis]